MPQPWAQARSQLALATRYGADEQRLSDLRRELRMHKLQRAIEKCLAEAPPLTDEQRTRLAALLRPVPPTRQDF